MNARSVEAMDGLRSAEWAGGSNDALILQYGNLVRCIAHRLVRRMPRSIEVEDLVQSGMIGLLEAARRYDDIKGFSFVSFATPRIRGAMLDAHRLSDWSPRSLRRRQRAIKRASTEIEMKTGAAAKASAIAAALGISIDSYFRAERDLFAATQLSLEQLAPDGSSAACGEPIDGRSGLSEQLEREQLFRTIGRAIDRLSESERLVFLLYYDEEFLMREIGARLALSESRVCQILRRVIARLRASIHAGNRRSLGSSGNIFYRRNMCDHALSKSGALMFESRLPVPAQRRRKYGNSWIGGLTHRARIEFCIDAFVEETGYVPAGARPVMNPRELSPALERVAHSLSTTVWRAWGEGVRQWFVHGRSGEWPDHSACPTLHLIFLDQEGRSVAAGVWHRSGPAQWEFDGPLEAACRDGDCGLAQET